MADRYERESKENEVEKDVEDEIKTRKKDRSRVGCWTWVLDGGVRSGFHCFLGMKPGGVIAFMGL